MLTCQCNQCLKIINRDDGGWFGVDWTPPTPTVVQGDDDADTVLVELHELAQDHEFHFCSPSCLQAWSFEREFAPSEGTTT